MGFFIKESNKMNIKTFFDSVAFAAIGVSSKREKFGNKVLRCYQSHNMTVFPIHPLEVEIEGIKCLKSISELPDSVKSLSVITPPSLTERVVEQANTKGIKNIWMQPGAASDLAIAKCNEYGINVIANGPCILVELGCY